MRKTSPTWWSWLLLACPPMAVAVAAYRMWENARINREWEAQIKDSKERL
jgi:dephospho-CoA kinase